MTKEDFLTDLMIYFSVELLPDQIALYKKQLNQFDDHQLEGLFEMVLKHCKQFPKIAHLVSIADEQMGILLGNKKFAESKKVNFFEWQKTSCRLCQGEGRILVWFETYTTRNEDGSLRTGRKLVQIDQMSDPDQSLDRPKGCVKYAYRCSCTAGEREGLPKEWPRWKEYEVVDFKRKQYAKDSDPDPFYMDQVKDVVKAAGSD